MGAVSNESEYSVKVMGDIVELEINGRVICKSIQLWHNLALRELFEQSAVESKDTGPVITEDRFEQLAKEASFNIYQSDLWRGTGQRFAESLVKECADLYTHDDVMAPVGQSAYGEAYQDGWIEGTKAFRETILEHFGVK